MSQVRCHGRARPGRRHRRRAARVGRCTTPAVLHGLRPDSYVLVNSSRGVEDIGLAALTQTECPVSLELTAVTHHA